MKRVRILGVDPGSRLTGFGCVDLVGGRLELVTHGTLRLSNTGGKAVIPLERRLLSIYEGLSRVIEEHRPQILSVERVFFAKNAVSALKLGQARGAVVLSGAIHRLEIVEYSPSEVKAAIVGHGQADKEQVARMIERLVAGARDFDTSDASDGLALAVCHARMLGGGDASSALGAAVRTSGSKKGLSLADALGITPEMAAGKRRLTLPRD